MTAALDAVVVGSGPNGLAAAITLAAAGRSVTVLEAAPQIGGGLRTDLLEDGVRRDHCASVMPFAIGSPFLRSLPLSDHGLEWLTPEVSFSHPLDHGEAGLAFRSLDATVEALGPDGPRYRRVIGPLVEHWDALATEVLQPVVHLPRHPLVLARFGSRGVFSAARFANHFRSSEAQAIIAGCAAHSVLPLSSGFTGAFALLFLASAHRHGWPVARGGATTLAQAMEGVLASLGGHIEVDRPVTSLGDVPDSRAVLFDVNPAQLAAIAGDRLDARYRKRLVRYRHGPGVHKIDYLLDGPVPWANSATSRAATVHVGGTFSECAAAEAQVARGEHPEHPFVLVAQAGAVDDSRAPAGREVLWAYTHVPAGSDRDMAPQIEAQIERFAPGFRDRILRRWVTRPSDFEADNANLVGGDITGGALHGLQLVARPRMLRPYRTPDDTVLLCSASTPPGGGVHGMCGHLAAKQALAGPLR